MKLKYYLRGLGIGIILTTILLSIGSKDKAMSDQEIIEAATKLGMVKKEEVSDEKLEQVLENSLEESNEEKEPEPSKSPEQEGTDLTGDPKEKDNISPIQDPKENDNISPAPETDAEDVVTPLPTTTPSEDDSLPEESEENHETVGEAVTFTIERGMSSGKVARLLKEKGLIEDAEDFNAFIMEEGKASIIRIGTYTLPMGADYEEILDLITE